MLYREGTAVDFNDLMTQYIEFLQCYNDDTISWHLIDPRLNTFYGATMSIPKSDYIVDEGNYIKPFNEAKLPYKRGTIVSYNGNNYRQLVDDSMDIPSDDSPNWHKMDKTNIVIFYDNGVETKCIKDYNTGVVKHNKDYFVNTITRTVPNSDVVAINYDDLITSINPHGHIDYVGNSHNNIDKLIVFVNRLGFESGGRNNSEFVRNVEELDYECYVRGIDVEYVYAPSVIDINSKSYVESISFINFVNNYITKYTKLKINNFFTDVLNKFDGSFLSKVYSDYANKESTKNHIAYNKSIADLLTRYLMNEIFHSSVEEVFVSFHGNSINSSTYYNFIYNNDEYMSEELIKLQVAQRSIHSKYGSLNPFRNSGDLVSIGMHTSFDYDVWMCEQGGITCKKEEDEQINDINLLPFWVFSSSSPSKRLDPVVYPTTGCPWFTVSTNNKSKYMISSDNPIHYYFVKDNSNSTITIRFCDGHGQLADVWQTISFGKLDRVTDKYNINPLYCVGGNSALSPDTWTYYNHSHIEGLSYDLDFKNPSLVNSNFLHPTKFGSANLSNFRVMVNSGEWRDIYAHHQTFSTYQYYTLSGVNYNWGVPLNEPTDNIGSSTHTAYPFGSSIRDRIDTYSVKKSGCVDKFASSGQLDRLTVYLYDTDARNGV